LTPNEAVRARSVPLPRTGLTFITFFAIIIVEVLMNIANGEGGFIKAPRDRDSKRRFRRERCETRNALKTSADFAAERQAALRRWAGIPPLAAAREIIAEANIEPLWLGAVSKAISEMPEEQLAEFVNSGQLSQQLAELAAG